MCPLSLRLVRQQSAANGDTVRQQSAEEVLGVQLSETQLEQSMLAASTEEQAAPSSSVTDQPAAENEKVRSWDHSSAR